MFMDLPIHAKRVGILVKRQRFRCKSCGSTFLEELQMMDDKRSATNRMLKYVGEQSMQRTL
jgi:transposase-like protein